MKRTSDVAPTYKQADHRCNVLSRARGIIGMQRTEIACVGANRAALYVTKALKSLDGAIRHAQRLRDQAERREHAA